MRLQQLSSSRELPATSLFPSAPKRTLKPGHPQPPQPWPPLSVPASGLRGSQGRPPSPARGTFSPALESYAAEDNLGSLASCGAPCNGAKSCSQVPACSLPPPPRPPRVQSEKIASDRPLGSPPRTPCSSQAEASSPPLSVSLGEAAPGTGLERWRRVSLSEGFRLRAGLEGQEHAALSASDKWRQRLAIKAGRVLSRLSYRITHKGCSLRRAGPELPAASREPGDALAGDRKQGTALAQALQVDEAWGGDRPRGGSSGLLTCTGHTTGQVVPAHVRFVPSLTVSQDRNTATAALKAQQSNSQKQDGVGWG